MKNLLLVVGIPLYIGMPNKATFSTSCNSKSLAYFYITKTIKIKKIFLVCVFMLFSSISYSQVNRYSKPREGAKYQPLSFEELSRVPMALQKKYNENQEYLYNLKQWILELKPQIREEEFLNKLEGEYSVLTSMESDDLARATNSLKQRENSIREIISEYKVWLSNQKSESQISQSPSKSTNYERTKEIVSKNDGEIALDYFRKGEYAQAIRHFSSYLENDKNNTDFIFYRALAKSEIGDRYGAIGDYEKIIELNSNYPMQYNKLATVYNNKAYSLVQLNEHLKALPFVEKALNMDKSEWFIWDTRGEIYLAIGQYEKSIEDLTKAINIRANDNSYYLRGLANLKLGFKEKGCRDLSKAGELGNEQAYDEITKKCN